VDLANLGSELETCVGSYVHLAVVSISFEKNFYWLPFTPPPLSGSPYRSFNILDAGGSFHVGHGRDLLRVGFDSTMANDKAE
jgi:hypothetical protein